MRFSKILALLVLVAAYPTVGVSGAGAFEMSRDKIERQWFAADVTRAPVGCPVNKPAPVCPVVAASGRAKAGHVAVEAMVIGKLSGDADFAALRRTAYETDIVKILPNVAALGGQLSPDWRFDARTLDGLPAPGLAYDWMPRAGTISEEPYGWRNEANADNAPKLVLAFSAAAFAELLKQSVRPRESERVLH